MLIKPHDTVVALKLGTLAAKDVWSQLVDESYKDEINQMEDSAKRELLIDTYENNSSSSEDILPEVPEIGPDEDGERIDYRTLSIAKSIGLSQGEVSKSIQRLIKFKLLAPCNTPQRNSLVVTNMFEWLVHGLKYYISIELGPVGRGSPTAWSNKRIESEFMPSEIPYVWGHAGGNITGQTVSPLYPNISVAISNDSLLHDILSLVDCIRIGKPREIKIAEPLLEKKLEIITYAQQHLYNQHPDY